MYPTKQNLLMTIMTMLPIDLFYYHAINASFVTNIVEYNYNTIRDYNCMAVA
jgi:hypothetical protein